MLTFDQTCRRLLGRGLAAWIGRIGPRWGHLRDRRPPTPFKVLGSAILGQVRSATKRSNDLDRASSAHRGDFELLQSCKAPSAHQQWCAPEWWRSRRVGSGDNRNSVGFGSTGDGGDILKTPPGAASGLKELSYSPSDRHQCGAPGEDDFKPAVVQIASCASRKASFLRRGAGVHHPFHHTRRRLLIGASRPRCPERSTAPGRHPPSGLPWSWATLQAGKVHGRPSSRGRRGDFSTITPATPMVKRCRRRSSRQTSQVEHSSRCKVGEVFRAGDEPEEAMSATRGERMQERKPKFLHAQVRYTTLQLWSGL